VAAPTAKAANGSGGNLGFEAEMFRAADKLRGNMEPSDYKHVALGLVFLKYISDAFEAKHAALLADDPASAEDKDEYLAEQIFWVPKGGRWSHLKANAKQATIGTLIDDAMRAIESENPSLKGVLPKDYARPSLNTIMLGELIAPRFAGRENPPTLNNRLPTPSFSTPRSRRVRNLDERRPRKKGRGPQGSEARPVCISRATMV